MPSEMRKPFESSIELVPSMGEWFVRSVVEGRPEIESFANKNSAVRYAERQRRKLRVHRIVWMDRVYR